MKKAFLALCACLFFSVAAHAQYTVVTGTIIDPNGWPYANATISAVLVPSTPGRWTLSGLPYAGIMPNTNLDFNGSFRAALGDNSVILPAGTQWQFTVNTQAQPQIGVLGTGAQSFQITLTISGASQDITAALTAAAKVVSYACHVGVSCGGTVTLPITSSELATANITYTKTFILLDWVDNTDSGKLQWEEAKPIHLTRVYGSVVGATNASINLDKRSESTPNTDTGNHLLGGDLTITTTGANTNTFANGSGQCGSTLNCAIATHTNVVLTITSVSGAATGDAMRVTVEYTVD
jgi:hypothetical protein